MGKCNLQQIYLFLTRRDFEGEKIKVNDEMANPPEIAHSMLRRQRASAVVAARHKIVEGTVGIVESALNLLSDKKKIEFDDDKKATMVSNLMVVLCGDGETKPVINTWTLWLKKHLHYGSTLKRCLSGNICLNIWR